VEKEPDGQKLINQIRGLALGKLRWVDWYSEQLVWSLELLVSESQRIFVGSADLAMNTTGSE
jgi:hypothetical protein